MAGRDGRRGRQLAAALGLLVLAVLAVWAATRLWRTDVPGDLPEPAVDVDATFGAHAVDEARSFETFLLVSGVLGRS